MWKYCLILFVLVGCNSPDLKYSVGDIVETIGDEKAVVLREYPAVCGYDIDIVGSGQQNTFYPETCIKGLWTKDIKAEVE